MGYRGVLLGTIALPSSKEPNSKHQLLDIIKTTICIVTKLQQLIPPQDADWDNFGQWGNFRTFMLFDPKWSSSEADNDLDFEGCKEESLMDTLIFRRTFIRDPSGYPHAIQ